jgi:hypothetical protein
MGCTPSIRREDIRSTPSFPAKPLFIQIIPKNTNQSKKINKINSRLVTND